MAKKTRSELGCGCTRGSTGVKRVYGVAGDSLNRITDIIHTGGRLQRVHMRHEEDGPRLPLA